jgi:2-methylcitrate dehydratase PrpD
VLASKVGYEVDPTNPYPDEYTGTCASRMTDGRVLEERQPHLRGGQREPLTRADIEEKFRANCGHGNGIRRASRRGSRSRARHSTGRST